MLDIVARPAYNWLTNPTAPHCDAVFIERLQGVQTGRDIEHECAEDPGHDPPHRCGCRHSQFPEGITW